MSEPETFPSAPRKPTHLHVDPSTPPEAEAPSDRAGLSAAARAAGDAGLVEPLLCALEFLGDRAGVEVDRSAARKALDEASRDTAFIGPEAWFEELARAGAAVGLSIRTLRRGAVDVIASAPSLAPLVTLAAGREGAMHAVAIMERHGARVRVVTIGAESEAASSDASRLAEITGAASVTEPVTWALAEPLEPLASLGGGGINERPSPFKRLVSLLHLERDDVGVALVYAIGVGIVSLAAPMGVQALVNTVAFGGLLQPLVVLTVLVFVALAFAGVLRAMQAYVVERIQQRVFVRVAVDLAQRLPRVRASALGRSYGPELVNRFFDVLTVQKGAATLLVDGVSIALQTAVGALVLGFYHSTLLVFDAALVAAVAFVLLGLGRGAVKTSVKESKVKYAVAAWLEEMARHPAAFRSSGGASFARARTEDLLRGWLGERRKHFDVLFRQIIGSLVVGALASAALLGVGGWLVIEGKLTLGQLVAAELIVTSVVAGIAKFGKHLESFYDLCAGVDKIGQLVDLPLEPPGGAPFVHGDEGARVELVGVSFGYPGKAPLLDRVDLDLKPGARVALLGSSGAGKSTLLDLVYALHTPTRGRVDVDGTDMRHLDMPSLREHVALLRGSEIFEGTVADNVRVGRADVTTREVRAALEAVGLWEEIAALPEGLDTRLTTGGAILSRGQALQICAARAIAGRPRLILLDEPLQGMDPTSRRTLFSALFDQRAPWTLLTTTQDKDVLRICDEIFMIDAGRVRPLRAGDLS